jgi:hypothetical protein
MPSNLPYKWPDYFAPSRTLARTHSQDVNFVNVQSPPGIGRPVANVSGLERGVLHVFSDTEVPLMDVGGAKI